MLAKYGVCRGFWHYGMDPQIKFFETACITDNSVEAVLLPDAAE